MLDDKNNPEIEVSLLLLGCGYAALIVTLIILFAGQLG